MRRRYPILVIYSRIGIPNSKQRQQCQKSNTDTLTQQQKHCWFLETKQNLWRARGDKSQRYKWAQEYLWVRGRMILFLIHIVLSLSGCAGRNNNCMSGSSSCCCHPYERRNKYLYTYVRRTYLMSCCWFCFGSASV